MLKPNPDRYSRQVGAIVSTLTAVEKADLHAQGRAPERLDADSQKTLRSAIEDIWVESDAYLIYEARRSESPRDARGPPRRRPVAVPKRVRYQLRYAPFSLPCAPRASRRKEAALMLARKAPRVNRFLPAR